jgi:hypothetical protein
VEFAKIVLFSIGCAICYGILHDQVTAHVCVEYFTVGHVSLVSTTNPTVLAFVWGVVATWWVGLSLGVLAALVARLGPWPMLTLRDLRSPLLMLLLGMSITSIVAGLAGFLVARTAGVQLPQPLASDVPHGRHALFLADWWAHENAYTIGIIGGLTTCIWLWDRRRRRQQSRLLQGVVGKTQSHLLTQVQLLWRRFSIWSWDRTRPVGLLARIVAAAALLIFLWGTSNIMQAWITTPGDDYTGYSAALLGWPIFVFTGWLLGSVALLMARQWRAAMLFLGLCVTAAVLGTLGLATIVGSAGVSVTESLLLLDAGIVYVSWHLILHTKVRSSASR